MTSPEGVLHGPVIASAPGKVNVFLEAGAAEEDGYHPLTTIFQSISLREYVRIVPNRRVGVEVEVFAYRPTEPPVFDKEQTHALRGLSENNIVQTAAKALFEAAGRRVPDLKITIHKTVPVAGGMAGGSADAAAVLVGLNEAAGLGFTSAELQDVGKQVGADVPACLVGGLALGLGRGDCMRMLQKGTGEADQLSLWWVACVFNNGLSTAEVFKQFDAAPKLSASNKGAGRQLDPNIEELFADPQNRMTLPLRNDLQAPAYELRADLRTVEEKLSEGGCIATLMSGAGPTMLGLAADEADAHRIAEAVTELPGLQGAFPIWGPAVGAQIESGLPHWVQRT